MKKESKFRAFIKKHFSIIVLIAILTIPSIYTVLFLGSMWDPYGNTGSLPVAIVNEDVAVYYNDKELNIGNQMCNTLKKNDSLQFNFVDDEVAMDGLDNGTYYMVVVIPEKFSYNATTLTSDNPTKMELEYYTNPGNNYIASKISNSAAATIKASINESVINTYARTVFDSIVTAGDGFQRAADGSGQIKDGLVQLGTGNNKLADGIGTLANGCLTLKDGTSTLEAGTVTLKNGTYKLKDGTITLKAGTSTLKQGITDYTNGVSQVYNGTQQLTANNKTLNDGAGQINSGLQQVSDTIGQSLPAEQQAQLVTLEEGLITLNDGIQTLNNAINEGDTGKNINGAIAQLTDASKQLDEFVKSDTYQALKQYNPNQYLQTYDTLVAKLEEFNFWKLMPKATQTQILSELKKIYDDAAINNIDLSVLQNINLENLSSQLDVVTTSLNSLTSGVKQLSDGGNQALPVASSTLKQLSGGLLNVKTALDMTQAKDGQTGLIEGMTTLQNGLKTYTSGVSQVDSGVSQLVSNTPKLTDGVKHLDDGATQLVDGATQLNDGALSLNDGASQLSAGAVKLLDGSSQLSDGDNQISDGIDKLLVGSKTLQSSLQDGANTVKDTNTDDKVTDMFASPVNSTEHQVTDINNNGEAMAAYMMCAGLWVGCLAFCLMFSPYNAYLANKKGQKKFLTFAFISVFVAVMQAALMVALIMSIDGMAPQHVILTFFMAVLASVAFMSIVFFFNTLLGSVGSFVLLIFLVLQLSGAAGTYPIELSPKFYQIIHPLMPFTYGVSAFRSTISTGANLTNSIVVFLGIIAVSWFLTVMTFVIRSYRQSKKARKELDMKFEEEMSYYNSEMQQ